MVGTYFTIEEQRLILNDSCVWPNYTPMYCTYQDLEKNESQHIYIPQGLKTTVRLRREDNDNSVGGAEINWVLRRQPLSGEIVKSGLTDMGGLTDYIFSTSEWGAQIGDIWELNVYYLGTKPGFEGSMKTFYIHIVGEIQPGQSSMIIVEQKIDGQDVQVKGDQDLREGQELRTRFRPIDALTGNTIMNVQVTLRLYNPDGGILNTIVRTISSASPSALYTFNSSQWNATEGDLWRITATFGGNSEYDPCEKEVKVNMIGVLPDIRETRVVVHTPPPAELRELQDDLFVRMQVYDAETNERLGRNVYEKVHCRLEVKHEGQVVYQDSGLVSWTTGYWESRIDPSKFDVPSPVVGTFIYTFYFEEFEYTGPLDMPEYLPSQSGPYSMEILLTYGLYSSIGEWTSPEWDDFYGKAWDVEQEYERHFWQQATSFSSFKTEIEKTAVENGWRLLRLEGERRVTHDLFGYVFREEYRFKYRIYEAGTAPIVWLLIIIAGALFTLFALELVREIKNPVIIEGPDIKQYCKDVVKYCGAENEGEILQYTCPDPDSTVIDACECVRTADGTYVWQQIGECPTTIIDKPSWQSIALLLGGATIAAGAGIYIFTRLIKRG